MKTTRPSVLLAALGLVGFLAVGSLATSAHAECTSPPREECSNALNLPCPYSGTEEVYPGVCHPYPQPRPKSSIQTTPGCTVANSATCCDSGDCTTQVTTGEGIYPACNPFCYATFPGNNLLPNVYTNMFDGAGNEMLNTLPSTPDIPYNLHDGDPIVQQINPTSATDDLATVFHQILVHAFDLAEGPKGSSENWDEQKKLLEVLYRDIPVPDYFDLLGDRVTDRFQLSGFEKDNLEVIEVLLEQLIHLGLDIIEGNSVPNRFYSGFPLLHYNGPEKLHKVEPIRDGQGRIIGGNINVHQIWYGQHIESDTAFPDITPLLYDKNCQRLKDEDGNDLNVPWTITYTIDVLNRGHDDFSPFVTYFDPYLPVPGKPGKFKKVPHVGMDQTFFDMEEGTRTILKIKMAPAEYLNLIYTWGWRMHPPRIQVMENTVDQVNYGGKPFPGCNPEYEHCLLPQIEKGVFCNPDDPGAGGGGDEAIAPSALTCAASSACKLTSCSRVRCAPGEPLYDEHGKPTQCRKNQLYAINQIGDLAPAKRMWHALRAVEAARKAGSYEKILHIIDEEALPAYLDWRDRTLLPDGVEADPESDITILYVNNTIYGELTDGGVVRWDAWEERPKTLKVTAYNGDHFTHAYNIADFGGNRGWENQFKSSVKVAGSGCWFTFGRAHWWLPVGGPNGFLCVPPVDAEERLASTECGYGTGEDRVECGKHRFEVEFNFDPSRRLRFYQFDPFHHDVAIYSLH